MSKRKILIIHSIFWCYIILQVVHPVFLMKLDAKYYLQMLHDFVWFVIIFYLMHSIVIGWLSKFKYKVMAIFLGVCIVGIIGLVFYTSVYYIDKMYLECYTKENLSNSQLLVVVFRSTIVTTIYAILMRFTVGWFLDQKQKADLIMQNQSSELALLKYQINPHFLFNTINNIYSLVYRKSDEAAPALMKLSEIMRYMLYDTASEKVSLTKEIEYLKSFIQLQLLRIKEQDCVSLNIKVNSETARIAPMILIPFVENAFKHGSKKSLSPCITIELEADSKTIKFSITNYCSDNDIGSKDISGGIGLQNVRRRLELIYPNKHNLEISASEGQFMVNLELEV